MTTKCEWGKLKSIQCKSDRQIRIYGSQGKNLGWLDQEKFKRQKSKEINGSTEHSNNISYYYLHVTGGSQ